MAQTPTAAADEAAEAAAALAAATNDLAALQTFQTIAITSTSTIAQLQAGELACAAAIADPGRLAQFQGLMGGYIAFLNGLAAVIAVTSAVINPPSSPSPSPPSP